MITCRISIVSYVHHFTLTLTLLSVGSTLASKLHCIVSLQIHSIESPMITRTYSVCTVTLL